VVAANDLAAVVELVEVGRRGTRDVDGGEPAVVSRRKPCWTPAASVYLPTITPRLLMPRALVC
jgi:hypothetical protein